MIIHDALNNAERLNKFRTFAKVFRATIDPYFSAEMNEGQAYNRDNMTFQEWACYRIGDDSFSHESPERIEAFRTLATKKGLL